MGVTKFNLHCIELKNKNSLVLKNKVQQPPIMGAALLIDTMNNSMIMSVLNVTISIYRN